MSGRGANVGGEHGTGGADREHRSIGPSERNVELIAKLEEDALRHRSMAERLSDTIVKRIGTMSFVLVHAVGLTVWFVVNMRVIPGVRPFDPFPFGILTLIVSAEGVFLAIFILVSQNRMTRQADRRAHLDLQISLLAEEEMTNVLRMLESVCDHFRVRTGSRHETQRLMEKTDVQQLAEDLERKLPNE